MNILKTVELINFFIKKKKLVAILMIKYNLLYTCTSFTLRFYCFRPQVAGSSLMIKQEPIDESYNQSYVYVNVKI